MKKKIPFHLIERHPAQSQYHWLYIFDRAGRRRILAMTAMELPEGRPRLMITYRLVRKGIDLGPLEVTSLKDLSIPRMDVALLDHLAKDPLRMGEAVATFLDQNIQSIVGHLGGSAHERMDMASKFRRTLAKARDTRKRTAERRRGLPKSRRHALVAANQVSDA